MDVKMFYRWPCVVLLGWTGVVAATDKQNPIIVCTISTSFSLSTPLQALFILPRFTPDWGAGSSSSRSFHKHLLMAQAISISSSYFGPILFMLGLHY